MSASHGVNRMDSDEGEVIGEGYISPKHTSWEDMGLPRFLLANLQKHQLLKPTSVQRLGIHTILSTDRDVTVSSPTGTGKTATYLVPLIAALHSCPRNTGESALPHVPQMLILAPTHELVKQIHNECLKFAVNSPWQIWCHGYCYNYTPSEGHADIVVATPNRVIGALNGKQLDLGHVRWLILDEADRMMLAGFAQPLCTAINACSHPKRRLLLFSATISAPVVDVASRFMRHPLQVRVREISSLSPKLIQHIFHAKEEDKMLILEKLVTAFRKHNYYILVFVNTSAKVPIVATELEKRCPAENICTLSTSSSFEGSQYAMEEFKQKRKAVMIATDIAAWGLDFPRLEVVINYDMPSTVDDFIHRLGCTARAGRAGTACSLYNDDSLHLKPYIIKLLSENGQQLPDFWGSEFSPSEIDIFNAPRSLASQDLFPAGRPPDYSSSSVMEHGNSSPDQEDHYEMDQDIKAVGDQRGDSHVNDFGQTLFGCKLESTTAIPGGQMSTTMQNFSGIAAKIERLASNYVVPTLAPPKQAIPSQQAQATPQVDVFGPATATSSDAPPPPQLLDMLDANNAAIANSGDASSSSTALDAEPSTTASDEVGMEVAPEIQGTTNQIAQEDKISLADEQPGEGSEIGAHQTIPTNLEDKEAAGCIAEGQGISSDTSPPLVHPKVEQAAVEQQKQVGCEQGEGPSAGTGNNDTVEEGCVVRKLPSGKTVVKRVKTSHKDIEAKRRQLRMQRFQSAQSQKATNSTANSDTSHTNTPPLAGATAATEQDEPMAPPETPSEATPADLLDAQVDGDKVGQKRKRDFVEDSSKVHCAPSCNAPSPQTGVTTQCKVPSPEPMATVCEEPSVRQDTGTVLPKHGHLDPEEHDSGASNGNKAEVHIAPHEQPSSTAASAAETLGETCPMDIVVEPPAEPIAELPHSTFSEIPCETPTEVVAEAPAEAPAEVLVDALVGAPDGTPAATSSSDRESVPAHPGPSGQTSAKESIAQGSAPIFFSNIVLPSVVPAWESVPQLHTCMLALLRQRAQTCPLGPLTPTALPDAFHSLVRMLREAAHRQTTRLRTADLTFLDGIQHRAYADFQAKQAQGRQMPPELLATPFRDRCHTRYWHTLRGLQVDLLRAIGVVQLDEDDPTEERITHVMEHLTERMRNVRDGAETLEKLLRKCEDIAKDDAFRSSQSIGSSLDDGTAEKWESHILSGTGRQLWINDEAAIATWAVPVKAETVSISTMIETAINNYDAWRDQCAEDAARVAATDNALAVAREALRNTTLLRPSRPVPPEEAFALAQVLRRAHDAIYSEATFRRCQSKRVAFPLELLLNGSSRELAAHHAEELFLIQAVDRLTEWKREMAAMKGIIDSALDQQTRMAALQQAKLQLQQAEWALEDEMLRLRLAEQRGNVDGSHQSAIEAATKEVERCKTELLQATQNVIGLRRN